MPQKNAHESAKTGSDSGILLRPCFLKSAKSIPLIVGVLFRLMNPVGGSPVFLLLTREYDATAQAVGGARSHQQSHFADPLTVGAASISLAITLRARELRRLGATVLAILSAAIASAQIALSVYLCLRVRGSVGGGRGAEREGRDPTPVGVIADVHRRADFVERSECAGAYAPHLGRALSLAEALFMQRKRRRQSRTCAPACIIEIECMRTAILPH